MREGFRSIKIALRKLQKSRHAFLSIPLDQVHEQKNEIVKGDGEAMSLAANSYILLLWMVCGPEVSRLINEFKSSDELMKKKLK